MAHGEGVTSVDVHEHGRERSRADDRRTHGRRRTDSEIEIPTLATSRDVAEVRQDGISIVRISFDWLGKLRGDFEWKRAAKAAPRLWTVVASFGRAVGVFAFALLLVVLLEVWRPGTLADLTTFLIAGEKLVSSITHLLS